MCGDRDTPLTISSLLSESQVESQKKYLKDYKKPPFVVEYVRLEFLLDDEGMNTHVYARICMRQDELKPVPLVLDGELLELIPGSLKIDGSLIPHQKFNLNHKQSTLTIDPSILPPRGNRFVIESSVIIKPAKNLALSGLYMSSMNYCTQCEGKFFDCRLSLNPANCENVRFNS